ncbi:MAG: hypothetical protein ACLSB9_30225 [Hydrogeniiclostridium mannosilyticum]
MARKYEKVKMLLPVVQQMQAERKTRKEIARDLGLKSKRAVKDWLYRARHNQEIGCKAARKETGQDIGRVQV